MRNKLSYLLPSISILGEIKFTVSFSRAWTMLMRTQEGKGTQEHRNAECRTFTIFLHSTLSFAHKISKVEKSNQS